MEESRLRIQGYENEQQQHVSWKDSEDNEDRKGRRVKTKKSPEEHVQKTTS